MFTSLVKIGAGILLTALVILGFFEVSSLGVDKPVVVPEANFAAAVSRQAEPDPPEKFAVIIGIVYDNYELGSISFADQDASSLYTFLTQHMGYQSENVALLMNSQASREKIIQTLDWLTTDAGVDSNSEVVVFFSGHGLRTGPDIGLNIPGRGAGYALVPFDFKSFEYDRGDGLIWDTELVEYLSRIDPAKMWISIDTCFSGGFDQPGITGPGRVVTMSSRGDELSSEINEAQRSVMTQYMIEEGLKQGLPVEQAFSLTIPRAYMQFGQNPQISDGFPGTLSLS